MEATCSPPLLDIGLGRMLFFPVDFGEAIEALAVALDDLEEHVFGSYPILAVAIEGLIDNESFTSFAIES